MWTPVSIYSITISCDVSTFACSQPASQPAIHHRPWWAAGRFQQQVNAMGVVGMQCWPSVKLTNLGTLWYGSRVGSLCHQSLQGSRCLRRINVRALLSPCSKNIEWLTKASSDEEQHKSWWWCLNTWDPNALSSPPSCLITLSDLLWYLYSRGIKICITQLWGSFIVSCNCSCT